MHAPCRFWAPKTHLATRRFDIIYDYELFCKIWLQLYEQALQEYGANTKLTRINHKVVNCFNKKIRDAAGH